MGKPACVSGADPCVRSGGHVGSVSVVEDRTLLWLRAAAACGSTASTSNLLSEKLAPAPAFDKQPTLKLSSSFSNAANDCFCLISWTGLLR